MGELERRAAEQDRRHSTRYLLLREMVLRPFVLVLGILALVYVMTAR